MEIWFPFCDVTALFVIIFMMITRIIMMVMLMIIFVSLYNFRTFNTCCYYSVACGPRAVRRLKIHYIREIYRWTNAVKNIAVKLSGTCTLDNRWYYYPYKTLIFYFICLCSSHNNIKNCNIFVPFVSASFSTPHLVQLIF